MGEKNKKKDWQNHLPIPLIPRGWYDSYGDLL
jgi:hypothetical protein